MYKHLIFKPAESALGRNGGEKVEELAAFLNTNQIKGPCNFKENDDGTISILYYVEEEKQGG